MPPSQPAPLPLPRHAGSGTVLASMFKTVLAAASEATRLPPSELLSLTGVSADMHADPEARIPQPAYARLWDIIDRHADDPFFGLHFAERQVDASTFSVVGFAARSSRTLGEAIERVARYSRVINDVEVISLSREGTSVAVIGQNPRGAAPPWPRHKAEGAMANYVVLGRRWTGHLFWPLEVRFRHAAPKDLSEHRRIFGCPLRFGAPRNEIRLDAALLDRPMQHAAQDLSEYLGKQAERLLSSTQPQTLLDDVRRSVREALPSGNPELPTIARRLGHSARSLQRKLAEEGTSFARTVDEVRYDRAMELLGDRRVTVEEAGFLLGFADARGFRRAFERWTGRSPRDHRLLLEQDRLEQDRVAC